VSNCQHEWAGGIAIRRTSDGHLECGYCRETFVPASKLEQSLDINAKLAEENVQEHRLVESLQSRLSWRPIRDGRPTEPGFYAMIYMPSGPFHRDIISSKVATLAEIQDVNHFHDQWQWLGPLPITSFLVENHVHNYGDDGRCSCGIHALD
jgi:hypothetical protein